MIDFEQIRKNDVFIIGGLEGYLVTALDSYNALDKPYVNFNWKILKVSKKMYPKFYYSLCDKRNIVYLGNIKTNLIINLLYN